MKTVSAMEVRRHFGEIVNEVRLKSESVIIERGGKPVAMLTPVEGAGAARGGREGRVAALDRLRGLGGTTLRGRTAAAWVKHERTVWSERDR